MQKSLYGMMTLLDQYLHVIKRDVNGDVKFSASDFDDWGRACVMNQLDRLKSSKNIDVRNKVYDILDDYREFYRMLGVEIAALVANKNDLLVRLLQYFTASITPDMFKDTFEKLAESMQELKDYIEQTKEIEAEVISEG